MLIFSIMEELFNSLKKYNFWSGPVPALGYLRKDYTDRGFGQLFFRYNQRDGYNEFGAFRV